MKLAIVGHGFVGKAVDYGFNHPKLKKTIIDPRIGTAVTDLKSGDVDVAFVCVPTPMGPNGVINSSIVEDCVNYLMNNTGCLIVLKSTVTPDIVAKLASGPGVTRFVYNPEFLTEKSANEDFVNPALHVFGGSQESAEKLHKIYEKYSQCKPCPVHYMSAVEASFVKYGINSYLASKVLWFNQFYDIVEAHGASYGTVLNAMTTDSRIGKSHTSVPGFDNKRGFGGACFPKDTAAFLNFAKDFSVLAEVISANNKYRSQYEKDDREKEQNITFGDN